MIKIDIEKFEDMVSRYHKTAMELRRLEDTIQDYREELKVKQVENNEVHDELYSYQKEVIGYDIMAPRNYC